MSRRNRRRSERNVKNIAGAISGGFGQSVKDTQGFLANRYGVYGPPEPPREVMERRELDEFYRKRMSNKAQDNVANVADAIRGAGNARMFMENVRNEARSSGWETEYGHDTARKEALNYKLDWLGYYLRKGINDILGIDTAEHHHPDSPNRYPTSTLVAGVRG